MEKKPSGVAIYARVSTQEQAVEGTSLDHQTSQLNAYGQAQGWEVTHRYVDPGFTGKDDNRPGLQRLLADAKLGMFQKVVVYKLDRLARKLRLLLEIEEKLKDSGVSLHSVKETLDTSTPIGRTVFQVLGLVSEWEREMIVERTKNGRLQRYREHCWAGGKPPYGYSHNRDTKKLVIDESQARVVRRICSEYNAGRSLNSIANVLNADRVPARYATGKGWRPTAVRQVLINPLYKGTQIVNRHSHISNINKIDLSKTISIPVPPIISERAWQSAQEHLSNNKHVRLKAEDFLLQGLIKCGLCGHAYQTERVNKRRYYMCRGRLKLSHLDGSPRCTAPSIRADWLENEVCKRIENILNDPNRLAEVLKDTIENLRLREAELNARTKPINDRLSEIAAQKAKLADDWVTRNMDRAKFHELQQSLEKEETRLRSIYAEIDPAQIEELEATRGMLCFWEGQAKSMAWNTENEDGSMVRVVDSPHKTALRVVGFEDRELSKIMGFSASKRELLDRLQVRLVAFVDRIEVKALFPIEPVDIQLCTSTKRWAREQGWA